MKTLARRLILGTFGAAFAVAPVLAAEPPLSPFMVAISVADLQKETDWYVKMLDAKVVKDADFGGAGTHFRWLMIGTQRLELVYSPTAKDSVPARPKPPGHAGLHGFTHVTLATPDIAATKAALIAKGATLALDVTDVTPLGVRVLYLADPEGNAVEIGQQVGN
jgi:catechol 2,3-dioxygenase-like lactoylglutathione lyase family enzyme